MKKYFLFVALTSLFMVVKGQSYQEVDSYVYSNCNVYKTIIKSERFSFKVALAGKCDTLTADQYILDYESFLKKHFTSLGIKKEQRILLEFYEVIGFTAKDFERIKILTENVIGTKLIVSDRWKQGIEFKIIE